MKTRYNDKMMRDVPNKGTGRDPKGRKCGACVHFENHCIKLGRLRMDEACKNIVEVKHGN